MSAYRPPPKYDAKIGSDYLRYGRGRKVALDCHGIIPGHGTNLMHDWYKTYNRRTVELFVDSGWTLWVPFLPDPYDAPEVVEALMDRHGIKRPLLTGQCVGAATALSCLARRPDAYLAGAFYNPVSDPSLMDGRYHRSDVEPIDHMAIRAPVRIWHGLDDRLAAPEQSIRLSGMDDLTVYWLEGIGHREPCDAYVDGLKDYIATL